MIYGVYFMGSYNLFYLALVINSLNYTATISATSKVHPTIGASDQEYAWYSPGNKQNINNYHDIVITLIVSNGWYRLWGQDEKANITQTTFSNVFYSINMFEFQFKFHQGSNSQYSSIGLNNGLAPTRQKAIIWTKNGANRVIYASLCLNELSLASCKNDHNKPHMLSCRLQKSYEKKFD